MHIGQAGCDHAALLSRVKAREAVARRRYLDMTLTHQERVYWNGQLDALAGVIRDMEMEYERGSPEGAVCGGDVQG